MVPGAPPTLSLSGLSKADACSKIESEILRLKGQIRTLLSARNSLSPVASLPNELLAKVFMHCCDFDESRSFSNLRTDDEDSNENHDEGAQPDMRLVVSWVSHHWRDVALGHRQLWNLVVNLRESINLDYVRSCGARCQNLLVDLASPSNHLLDACLSSISQLAHLKLNLLSDAVIPSAISEGQIWSQPALVLRTLNLDSIHILSDNAKDYPKLQHLHLSECNFHWKFITSLASTLSKLEVYSPQRTLTIPACLALLSSLSLLSDCAFYYCFKDNEGTAPTRPRPNHLRLQNLTKLILADSMPHIIQLLQAIEIPRASLQSFVQKDKFLGKDYVELLCTLQKSHEHMWGSVRYLQVHDSFLVSNYEESLCHDIIVPNFHLLLLPACQKLDLTALESLWTHHLPIDVVEVFGHLTWLRRVVLGSSNALEDFVTFMCTKIHDNEYTPLFPALQELVLVHLDISAAEWLGSLHDILALRKIWGFGLQKLVLFECGTA
ncbi:hypothetical protein BDN72DRAFT_906014, partial [Pluteus cervinus]